MGSKRLHTKIGERYGRLTIIAEPYVIISPSGQNKKKVTCMCDCGKTKDFYLDLLRRGHTKSCGCFQKESRYTRIKHGESGSKLHAVWATMKARCTNPNNSEYRLYGQKGIVICDDWFNDYRNFSKWAYENGYKEGLSIDRIDSNGNYEPCNCGWATPKQQANNTCRNIRIEMDGCIHTLSEWCELYKKPYEKVRRKIHQGISLETALINS